MSYLGLTSKEYFEILSNINRIRECDSTFSYVQNIDGYEFEKLCGILIEKMGYSVKVTQKSNDGGIDIIANMKTPLSEIMTVIQCKKYSGKVGVSPIRELYGVLIANNANTAVLITTGEFTDGAIEFARDKQIELIDGKKLSELLQEYQITESVLPLNIDEYDGTVIADFCGQSYEDFKRIYKNQDNEDLVVNTLRRIEMCYDIITAQLCSFANDCGDIERTELVEGTFIYGVVDFYLKMLEKDVSAFDCLENTSSRQGKNLFLHLLIIKILVGILRKQYCISLKYTLMLINLQNELFKREIEAGIYEYLILYLYSISTMISLVKILKCSQFLPFIKTKYNNTIDKMRQYVAEDVIRCGDAYDVHRKILSELSACENSNIIIALDWNEFVEVTVFKRSLLRNCSKSDALSLQRIEPYIRIIEEDNEIFLEFDESGAFVDSSINRYSLGESIDETNTDLNEVGKILQKYFE